MGDFPNTHGLSGQQEGNAPPPVPMAEDNAILKSGGNGLWELGGNNCEMGCSLREGAGDHGLANDDALLVEIFILPLCPDRTLHSIRMADVRLHRMSNGHLLALFALSKRENGSTAVFQARKILDLYGSIPQLAKFEGVNGSVALSRVPGKLKNRPHIKTQFTKTLKLGKSEYGALKAKLDGDVNSGGKEAAEKGSPASPSRGFGVQQAVMSLMTLGFLTGASEVQGSSDNCELAEPSAQSTQILEPPMHTDDNEGRATRVLPRERAQYTTTEKIVPGKYGRGEILLPELELRPSALGGMGVFTRHFVPKGAYLTMYGGDVHNKKSHVLEMRARNEDTHVKRIGSRFYGHWLDSRVRGLFTLLYYTQNHLLGGFINDHYKSGKTKNVSEVDIEGTAHHPYSRGMSSRVTSRTLYRATEDLPPDTELLTSYDGLFRAIHIDCEDPETAANRHAEDIIAREVQEEAERGIGERMAETMVQTDVQVNCRREEHNSSVTM